MPRVFGRGEKKSDTYEPGVAADPPGSNGSHALPTLTADPLMADGHSENGNGKADGPPTPATPSGRFLGDLLVEQGLVTPEQVAFALESQKRLWPPPRRASDAYRCG